MKKQTIVAALAAISLFFIIAVSGCTDAGAQWSITMQGDRVINKSVYDSLANCNVTINDVNGVPLEIFLYYYGLYPVTGISVDGQAYDWRQEAYGTDEDLPFLILPDGRLYDGKSTRAVGQINVTTAVRPDHTSLELPASILYSLGTPPTARSCSAI
jgi:hypothetical protein